MADKLRANTLNPDIWKLHYGGRTLLAALSGALLALAYLVPSWFIVSWLAFVPLLFAIEKQGIAASYCYGLVAGLVFYTSAAHWIIEFLMLFKGYDQANSFGVAILFWIYCAQLPALLAASFTWFRRWLGASTLLLFPLLVVVFYSAFPMLFSVQLGESQSRFLAALQGIEWTGVHGLDFVIGLSNIALFRLLTLRRYTHPLPGLVAAVLAIAVWLGYGAFSTSAWDEKIAAWSSRTIGIVQPNEVPSLVRPSAYPGFGQAYPPEMEMTERLAAAGAELVIWPEGHYKRYFDDSRIQAAFVSEITRLDVALLFQDMERGPLSPSITANRADDGLASNDRDATSSDDYKLYNSVAFLQANGDHQGTYRKIKRVAFGETLPLLGQLPWAEAWIKNYFGAFFRETSRGAGPVTFNSDGLQIVPLICYETLFPIFSARSLPEQANGALLVGVSSDGWFGDTRQPFQHVNASALRAVENRVPMVHVVNNGPSVAVMPNGRVVFQSTLGQAGGFIVNLPHSENSGGSFFSRYPLWFIGAVYASLGAFLLLALWRRWTNGRASVDGEGGATATLSVHS